MRPARIGARGLLGVLIVALAMGAQLGVSAQAQDQTRDPLDGLQLYGSISGGALLSADQRDFLDFDGPGGGLALGASYPLGAGFLIEARTGLLMFQSTGYSTGSLGELGPGLRWEIGTPLPGVFLAPAVHVLAAQTGNDFRPSMWLSSRLTVRISEWFALGPELGYGRVIDFGERAATDAEFWMVSLTLVRRHDPRAEDRPPKRRPALPRPPPRRFAVRPAPEAPAPIEEAPPPTELSIELAGLLDEAVTSRHEVLLVPPVLFVTNRAEPIACGEAALFFAMEALGRIEGPVEIEGHADTRGDDAYNVELSLARARYVHDWLVDHGVDPQRLRIRAHGEHLNLVAEHDDDDGRRQLNRRVTFRMVRQPETEPAPDIAKPEPRGDKAATPAAVSKVRVRAQKASFEEALSGAPEDTVQDASATAQGQQPPNAPPQASALGNADLDLGGPEVAAPVGGADGERVAPAGEPGQR